MGAIFKELKTITHDALEIYDVTDIDNKAVAEETLKCINVVSSPVASDTMSEDTVLDLSQIHTKSLIQEIHKVLHSSNLRIKGRPWGQIHRQYESTNMHDHGKENIAWVYYVRVPENSGILSFQQFHGFTHTTKHDHIPEEGQLVIFPGYMVHSVTKNYNVIPRVSISGNAEYIKEGKEYVD